MGLTARFINWLRWLAWRGEPTKIDVDLRCIKWEKEISPMSKTLTVGSDFIGKKRALIPIRAKDPVSDDVHAPGTPVATSSDPAVAEATVYNLMMAIRFVGVGECDINLEDRLASGRTLQMQQPVHVVVAQDPQPTEIDVDTDEVTFEDEGTPHS